MFAGTQAQRILGSGRTEFRESGDDKALKAKTGTNCITIASDRAAQFFVGQQIAIGTALWNHSVLWGRTITAFKASTEVEAATEIYFDGDPVDIAVGNVIWSCVQKTGETTAMKCPNGCLENPEGAYRSQTLRKACDPFLMDRGLVRQHVAVPRRSQHQEPPALLLQ